MYERLLKKLSRTPLDDVLIDEGVLARGQVEDAQAEAEMTGRPLSHVLFEREEIDEWELAKMVARNYSLPFVDVVTYSTPKEAAGVLDMEFCRTNLLLPFDLFGDAPAVAVIEMPSPAILEAIQQRCGALPFLYVTLRSRLLLEVDARVEAGLGLVATPPRAAAATLAESPDAAQPTGSPAGAGAAGPLDDLEPASMRLGFNMHSRGSGTSSGPLPMPPPTARKPVARRAPPEKKQVAAAARSDAAAAAESAASTEPAAWQSIFDIGDESAGDS